ncbi:hypothetical protein I4I73_03420 [Pseudonocardia sp. KRD-184]|uniref:Uncharacterized protein n=1 Tax=Pseudonocardia oceani TaxID=2792013 RepID=A0ABS6UG65_9PSEU|nr:hypothetical protein [Pseudonocardia oceani]MBW0088265.1 hypothetical protein [Pseudonocardia oceani]MBW0095047.1 hypothetical protein [Pseudonocardia oceani]MBW0121100.1 hypothetical protein [Pseudonocardia oceani]MBW0131214.1 hypothetical protein [Pseudonocardia oceani]MBW0132619.1 hypothetical protein [Pseudonocardia oceani]
MESTPEAQLRAATGRRKRLVKQAEAARLAERAAILAALEDGMRQVDVVGITGYTREHVRRLADAEREERGSVDHD